MNAQVLNALLLKLKVLEATHSGPDEDVGQALRSFLESLTASKEQELERIEKELEQYAGLGQEFNDIAEQYSMLANKR